MPRGRPADVAEDLGQHHIANYLASRAEREKALLEVIEQQTTALRHIAKSGTAYRFRSMVQLAIAAAERVAGKAVAGG